MSAAKKFIDNLQKQKSNYTSPESAQDQANSLESLSSDIYTDRKRFLYELLQNADDASSGSESLELQIQVKGTQIIVSHKGAPFSEVDIESICSIGDGNKTGDKSKTGFKGIGFKSVFAHSECVTILSGEYCFKFDKKSWDDYWNPNWGNQSAWKRERKAKEKVGEAKMPWQIIPIWAKVTSALDLSKFNVSTIIKYNNVDQIERDIYDLFSNAQILLFLRSKNVTVSLLGRRKIVIEKINHDSTITLRLDGQDKSEWIIKAFTFQIDQLVKEEIKKDNRIPRKLRESTKTQLSFALPIQGDNITDVRDAENVLFTYLPTSVNFGFPFLVNANFLTDAGRQHLHDDFAWNIWLFEEIPLKYFEWIATLSTSKYSDQILRIIPEKLQATSRLKSAFNKGFDQAIKDIRFIPNKNGELLKVSEAIFDKATITDFISSKVLVGFLNKSRSKTFHANAIVKKMNPSHVFKRLGVEVFDYGDLDAFFNSKEFSIVHRVEENFDLIEFLYLRTQAIPKGDELEQWVSKLERTPFIFDQNDKLVAPRKVYFPSINLPNQSGKSISTINLDVLGRIKDNRHVLDWLRSLGVEEPTDLAFIEKSIIGDTEFVNLQNAVSIGRYLFTAHQKGLLKTNHYVDLSAVSLLTQDGNLVSAQGAFLSDFYEPDLKLERVYRNDFYVSEEYFNSTDLKSEWKVFFIRLGVKHTIEKTNIRQGVSSIPKRSLLSRYVDEKLNELAKENPNEWAWEIRTFLTTSSISLIEFAENRYDFARQFWASVFSNTEMDADTLFENAYFLKFLQWQKIGYFPWLISSKRIFPTTLGNCLRADEIWINHSEFREICGDYLPILDCDTTVPLTWMARIPFKQSLQLVDYLNLLTNISDRTVSDPVIQKDNQKRVAKIYERISSNYLHERETLRSWGVRNKLMAKDGKSFFNPAELSVVTIDGFRSSRLALCEEANEQVVELLRSFGVKIIDRVQSDISNSRAEIQDLKRQLLHILPLIAVVSVEKSKNRKDWEEEYNRLQGKLVNIRFYETDDIYISYGDASDRQKRSSWSEGDVFYYVGNWYKPRVLDGLIEPLSKFLGIRYAERHLSVLLSDDFKEGLEYLKERFGEEAISIIPEELRHPAEPEIALPNAGNRVYNQSDEDIGHKGELFVFMELKRIYSRKYGEALVETSTGFTIGNYVEVVWRNISEKSTIDHDFLILENGHTIFIDSKATPYGEVAEKVPFYLSPNEFKLMATTADTYLLARVFDVTTDPAVKFIHMKIYDY